MDAKQTALALSPKDAEDHNNLGITLKELGSIDEALAGCHQVVGLKTGFAEANTNLKTQDGRKFSELDYENLIEKLEPEIRELMEYLKLDGETTCLWREKTRESSVPHLNNKSESRYFLAARRYVDDTRHS